KDRRKSTNRKNKVRSPMVNYMPRFHSVPPTLEGMWRIPQTFYDTPIDKPAAKARYVMEPVSLADVVDQRRERFQDLATHWRSETAHLSLLAHKISHEDYLEIIGMGDSALEYLIEELQNNSPVWLPALRAIAGRKRRP